MTYDRCLLTGGTGFVGTHFAAHLLRKRLARSIVLLDLEEPRSVDCPEIVLEGLRSGAVRYVHGDVRRPLDNAALPKRCDLVVNLAAVHREPGHEAREYYETNLPGAEHVCDWASRVGCTRVVFTSSIAPYGPCEEARSESSVPTPETPYGKSKLAAEKIHLTWRDADPERRRLVIVRPGVIFGPGESGNVTRLVRAVIGRFFFYMGNRATIKAGGYIKELCNTLTWALERQAGGSEPTILYNFTMSPSPTVEQYVNAVCQVAGIRRLVPRLPYFALYSVAKAIDATLGALGIEHPFSPVRIRKLVRSNNIVPGYLVEHDYRYEYTLESAMQDWKRERPRDWR